MALLVLIMITVLDVLILHLFFVTNSSTTDNHHHSTTDGGIFPGLEAGCQRF